MTLEELARLVEEVRRLQKLYFTTRSESVLKASIVKERELDNVVENILNPTLY